MTATPFTLRSVFGTRFWVITGLALVILTLVLAEVLIVFQAFDAFYEYSRAHEDWDMDEFAMALLAAIVSCVVVGSFVAVSLARRLLRNETERQAAKERLLQAQSLIALGTMVGGTAHSINNHLMPIMSLADLVRRELPAGSTQANDLAKVVEAARSAAEMVNQLKTFARTHQGIDGTCQIGPATERAIDLARKVAPATARFDVLIDPVPAWVAVSAGAWEIVVINLVNNALDALQGQTGALELELQQVAGPAHPTNSGQADATGWVRLLVRDNGKGMNTEELKRAFEPFFTTKPVGKGTGLGLSESYGIVDKAGGHFEVASTEGEGTRIAVWLPTVPAPEPPATQDA